MKNNQTHVSKKRGHKINKVSSENGYSKEHENQYDVENVKQRPVNHLLLQLREMEKLNDGLVELLDKRTKELEEVVTATAKSVSVIGHDLRSPVCNVLAALELLKKKLESDYPAGYEQYINAASDSAKKTLNLLDKLLEWSVSINNCTTFNPVKINLHELLKDELGNVKSPITLKAITVDYSVAPGLNISGDIQMVRSIFRNLISNAIKFTGYGGKIKVKARAVGRFAEISVADNGAGMSPEQKKNILKSEAGIFIIPGSNGQINGIGLLLCREFIESHGSILHIESKPGKGSIFKFSLERID